VIQGIDPGARDDKAKSGSSNFKSGTTYWGRSVWWKFESQKEL